MNLSEPGQPAEMASGLRVSANLFSILRRPAAARPHFPPDEETVLGNHRVLVISHRLLAEPLRAATPTSSGARSASTARRTRSSACCPPRSATGATSARPTSSGPSASTEKETRDRSSTRIRLVGRRSPTVTRAQADAFDRRLRPPPRPRVPRRPRRERLAHPSRSTTAFLRQGRPADPRDADRPFRASSCSSPAPTWRTSSSPAPWPARASSPCAPPSAPRAPRCCGRCVAESLLLAFAGGVFAVYVALWTYDWFAVVSAGDSGDRRRSSRSTGHVLGLDVRRLPLHRRSPSAWPPPSSPCGST